MPNPQEVADKLMDVELRLTKDFGCRCWRDDLILITPEILSLLPNGFPLIDICDSPNIVGEDNIDGDIRFGVLAYGVRPDVCGRLLEILLKTRSVPTEKGAE